MQQVITSYHFKIVLFDFENCFCGIKLFICLTHSVNVNITLSSHVCFDFSLWFSLNCRYLTNASTHFLGDMEAWRLYNVRSVRPCVRPRNYPIPYDVYLVRRIVRCDTSDVFMAASNIEIDIKIVKFSVGYGRPAARSAARLRRRRRTPAKLYLYNYVRTDRCAGCLIGKYQFASEILDVKNYLIC
jgi:hypothetical protein